MKPTSLSGLQSHMSWWSDSPATKATCKRMSHRADRKAARQVPEDGWEDGDIVDTVSYIPSGPEHEETYGMYEQVGCGACRRCILHDDPGGCLNL